MAQRNITTTGSSSSSHAPPMSGNAVQRGHVITTVKEIEKTTSRNRKGNPVVKTKTRTVYYLDGKAVKLNWFDRFRLWFMGPHRKQAFLADKLLKQERRSKVTTRVK